MRSLLALTALLLFGPKVMALLQTLSSARCVRAFGGRRAVLASATLELVFSMLLAPVMMLFHSQFIASILTGGAVGWSAQPRDDRGVRWATAVQRHGGHMAAGWLAAGTLAWLAPAYLPWVLPVILGLVLAGPLTVLSSSQQSGLVAQRFGLLVIPEERDTPVELRTLLPDRRRRVAATPVVAPPLISQDAVGATGD